MRAAVMFHMNLCRVRLERSKEEHEQLHEKELSSIRKKSEKRMYNSTGY